MLEQAWQCLLLPDRNSCIFLSLWVWSWSGPSREQSPLLKHFGSTNDKSWWCSKHPRGLPGLLDSSFPNVADLDYSVGAESVRPVSFQLHCLQQDAPKWSTCWRGEWQPFRELGGPKKARHAWPRHLESHPPHVLIRSKLNVPALVHPKRLPKLLAVWKWPREADTYDQSQAKHRRLE